MRNVLHSGQDQKGAIFLSTGKRSEKIACKTAGCDTPHLGVICCGSRRTVLGEDTGEDIGCHMSSLTKKAWHSPAYCIPSAVGSHSAQ